MNCEKAPDEDDIVTHLLKDIEEFPKIEVHLIMRKRKVLDQHFLEWESYFIIKSLATIDQSY